MVFVWYYIYIRFFSRQCVVMKENVNMATVSMAYLNNDTHVKNV